MRHVNPDSPGTSRHRAHCRGAAIFEGLVVTSVAIVFLTSGIWLHEAYQAKLRAIRDARVAAWSKAMSGCGSGVALETIAPSVAKFDGGGEIPILGKWLGISDAAASATRTVEEPGGTGKTHTLRGRCVVTCNEKPKNNASLGSLPQDFANSIQNDEL